MLVVALYFTLMSLVWGRCSFVSSQSYILTPKESAISALGQLEVQEMAALYKLDEIANLKGTLFYTGEQQNVISNRNELEQWYYIEEDRVVSLTNSKQVIFLPGKTAEPLSPWHLTRVVSVSPDADATFPYSHPGSCHRNESLQIDTYIVDTGIYVDHPEFEGRARWGNNFVDELDTDCNNHGTHVAGLVGSKSYGVCVDANLVAVKVLDCQGSGRLSGVIQGIDWVFQQHLNRTSSKHVKSIINMSLGGGYSAAINRAVEACLKNDPDFYIVVAAGNENSDACDTSPAGAEGVLTVMASDKYDERAWFSNWGKCGNVYAPGVDVLSTVPGGVAEYSGTSMASPVMAGALNHYVDMFPQHNQKGLTSIVEKLGSANVIKQTKKNTKNVLVYLQRN